MELQIAEGECPPVLAMFNVPSCYFIRDPSVPALLGLAVPNPKTKRHTVLVYVAKDPTLTASDLVGVADAGETAVALAIVEGLYNHFMKAENKGAVIAESLSQLLDVLKERMQ